VLKTKATDDHIDEGDDEHKQSGGIVQDMCILLVFLIVDIKTTDYREKNSKQHLKHECDFPWTAFTTFY
jgi:hypothetical protein